MTKLSVNINKIATIRNARGGELPSVLDAAIKCQAFGADGITIHPRPDERHITKKDVFAIKPIITTEYNIEGYPSADFINMVIEVKPEHRSITVSAHSEIDPDDGRRIARRNFQKTYVNYDDNLDLAGANASFQNGLLSVTVPTRPEAAPVSISIK